MPVSVRQIFQTFFFAELHCTREHHMSWKMKVVRLNCLSLSSCHIFGAFLSPYKAFFSFQRTPRGIYPCLTKNSGGCTRYIPSSMSSNAAYRNAVITPRLPKLHRFLAARANNSLSSKISGTSARLSGSLPIVCVSKFPHVHTLAFAFHPSPSESSGLRVNTTCAGIFWFSCDASSRC